MKKQDSTFVPQAKTKPIPPYAIEHAYVKVPVVLGEAKVQLDLTANILFPEPVLEIKDIKKQLKLVQCRLLTPTNKLFLKGFVRKNIQYATPLRSRDGYIISDLHSLTTDIPFEAVAEIEYINKPEFHPNMDRKEFTFFNKEKLPKGFSEKEKLLSGDFSQYDQISGETYNELPYCELISSKFIEYDESLDRKMGRVFDSDGNQLEDVPFEEGTFTKIEEKMVVELKLKVLQKQQVKVNGYYYKKD